MAHNYLKLEDITAYKKATVLGDIVYGVVSKWNWFDKRTLGVQWTDSTDSIAANIAEGFGRFHKKDKQKFYYNSRGSVYESAHWTKRAYARKLVTEQEYNEIISILRSLPKDINMQIKLTEFKLQR